MSSDATSADASLGPSEPGPEAEPALASGVARSGLWSMGGQVAVLGSALLAGPFTIRLLGPVKYGVWSLLQNVLRYVALADLGMMIASTTFASERYAARDRRGEAAVIWTSMAITVALTSLAALAAGVAAPTIMSDFLHVPASLRDDSVIALRLVCITVVAAAVAGTVNTPQQVRLRWRSVTLASSGPTVLQTISVPIVLAATTGGLVAIAATAVLASALAAVLNFVIAVRLLPELKRPRPAVDVAGHLARYGGALAISGFAAIPLTTAERFFLAHYRSDTQVAYYAVAASVAALLTVVPIALSQPMIPALTRLTAEGRHDEHARLYHQVLKGMFLVGTPIALGLAFVAAPFFGLWAGPAYGVNSVTPFWILLGGLWLNTLAYVPSTQLIASGRASTLAVIHVAELIPYLVLAAVLTNALGAVGAAIAWSLRVAVDAVLFFAVVRIRQGLPWIPTPQRAMASLVSLLGLGAVLWALATVTASLPVRVGWSVVTLLAYAVLVWKLVLIDSEREGLGTLVNSIVPARFKLGLSGGG